MRLRAALFLGVGLALTGASLVAYGANLFRQLEVDSLRARFDVRGTERPPDDIVFVDIDTASLTALNETWPISRRRHARLIRTIGRGQPRAIAYDIQFTEETTISEDNALIGAVSDVRRIVLAATETDETGATNVFGGAPIPGFRPGNALIEPDPGGVLRRLRYSIGGLETFAVVAVETATGRPVSPFDDDKTWIDFHGPPGTIETLSFIDVYSGLVKPEFFRDKIVVVGTSLASEQDLHSTPVGENMPGGEVQANAISTVLRDLPLRSAPDALTLALILLFGGIPLAGLFLSLRGILVVAIAAGVGWVVVTQVAFERGHVVTSSTH